MSDENNEQVSEEPHKGEARGNLNVGPNGVDPIPPPAQPVDASAGVSYPDATVNEDAFKQLQEEYEGDPELTDDEEGEVSGEEDDDAATR